MSDTVIFGGEALNGTVTPGGSKNAALPIIFATLVTKAVSVISNVPDIGDVRVATEILRELGATVTRMGDTLTVDTRLAVYKKPRRELTSKIRASSYLIGACLSRFGIFHLSDFGGCNFCNRPIDMHLYAAEALGASIDNEVISAKRLRGGKIVFDKISVGATMNALIMAVSAKEPTVIEGAAREPHVGNLIEYLRRAGADIEVAGDTVAVRPAPLGDAHVRVITDMIEVGTFLLLGPLTEGRVTVLTPDAPELESFVSAFAEAGIEASVSCGGITLLGIPKRKISVLTAPHPGYPTDLQPQAAPLMAKYFGGVIDERVWQMRFSYLSALASFGVKYSLGGSTAYVEHSQLSAAECAAPDLRGGAAAVMCALAARGKSTIKNTEIIMRGYSDFWNKLISLGANIENEGDT